VLHHIRAYTNALHIASADRLGLIASYAVDAAVMDIYGALLNGATLVPIDLKSSGLPGLRQELERQRVTIYHSTPTVFRLLMRALENGERLNRVRLVVLGGEPATRDDFELFRRNFGPECILVNGLGPTESTLALQHFLDARSAVERHALPVGFPVEETEVLLLNRWGQAGQVCGEIAIRSRFVALGYWGRRDLTDAAFLPDPEGGDRRIYRTGDLGRLLTVGGIEFLGRRDHQVKVRGFRIELGEIESALSQHPGVRESAVVVHGQSAGDERLVACWVPKGTEVPANEELRGFIAEKLPQYMLPAAFVQLPDLPQTASGKVDRLALLARVPATEVAATTGQEPPRDDLERRLTGIWEDVLGVRPIGITDDFFALGGHSLLAVQVFARIEAELGKRLPLSVLLEAPTIERLAGVLRNDRRPEHGVSLVAIQARGSRPPLFCVHGHTGEVLFYRPLSERLGTDQPFYALQSRGLVGGRAHESIESMAADYVREIRGVQPRGPYCVGGYCLGALVAMEMAQQLRAQRQEVALVALFVGKPPVAKHSLVEKIRHNFSALRPLGAAERWLYVGETLEDIRQGVFEQIRSRVWRRLVRAYVRRGRQLPRWLQSVPDLNIRAARSHLPRPYPGTLTFFVSGETPSAASGVQHGWGGLVGADATLHYVAGDRVTMMKEPWVEDLAQRLAGCLRATGGDGAASAPVDSSAAASQPTGVVTH
jgi:thioesterase domain-containing protein